MSENCHQLKYPEKERINHLCILSFLTLKQLECIITLLFLCYMAILC